MAKQQSIFALTTRKIALTSTLKLEQCFCQVLLPTFSCRSVNDHWTLHRGTLSALADRYVSLAFITNDNWSHWFDKPLRKLRNKKNRSYNRAKRDEVWQTYKLCLKNYCSAVVSAIIDTTCETYHPCLILIHPAPKFWETISPARGTNTSITFHGTD